MTKDVQAYWVEVAAYNPRAPRILLTNDPDSLPCELEPYDPKNGKGPWWYDEESDIHYWNGNYTLEVLVADSIKLKQVTDIDFSKHHLQRCCLGKSNCPDPGRAADSGRDRFFGGMVYTNATNKRPELFVVDGKPSSEVVNWAANVFFRTRTVKPDGDSPKNKTLSLALAREFLGYCYRNSTADFVGMKKETSSWFASPDELWEACCDAIDIYFDLDPGVISQQVDDKLD